jgi:hypothetical protein
MRAVVELLDRYQPGYASLVAGSPPWCLDLLADEAGVVLPPAYREFCRTLAAEGGALLQGLAPVHPEQIADLYAKAAWMPTGRHLFIFGDQTVSQSHYFLDLKSPQGEEDAAVVRFALGPEGVNRRRRHADSLAEMLLLRGVDRLCLPTCLHRARWVDVHQEWAAAPDSSQDLTELLERMGFSRRAEVTSRQLFVRDDLALALVEPQGPRRPLSCLLGLRDGHELKRVEALLAEYTPLGKDRAPSG